MPSVSSPVEQLFPYQQLAGRKVVLEPLDPRHTPDLIDAALYNQSIFEHLRSVHLHDEQEVRDWVQRSIERARNHRDLPYAIVKAETARAMGCAWFVNVAPVHRRCGMGVTWISPDVLSTGLVIESKMLMLEHAFEHCRIVRVEFRADVDDAPMQRELDRLGATREGVLRLGYVRQEDHVSRDAVIFSIIVDEWPGVKARAAKLIGGEISDDEKAAALEALERAQRDEVELPLPRR